MRALHNRDDIAAHFWNGDGLSFAVISDRTNRDLATTAEAIFAFYDESFAPELTGSAQSLKR